MTDLKSKNDPLKSKNDKVKASAPDALPDFSTWSEEQIGFAPYWSPAPGKWFYAVPTAIDTRDPDFVRYLFRALAPIECQRGPKDDAESVLVGPGEYFSMSVYYALEQNINFYLESGIFPPLHVTSTKEVKTKTVGQTVWQFRVKVSPETRALLDAARAKQVKDKLFAEGERMAKYAEDERAAIAERS